MTRIQDYHDHYEWLSSYSWNDDSELLSRRQRKAQLKASRDGVRMLRGAVYAKETQRLILRILTREAQEMGFYE